MLNKIFTFLMFCSFIFWGCDNNPVGPTEKLGPIVFSANRTGDLINGETQLYMMEPDGSNLIQLTHTEDFGYSFPRWSADGKTIAFMSGKGNSPHSRTINLIDANGKIIRGLVSQGGAPVWSPDGRRIAFSKDARCGGPCSGVDVCILDLDSKTQRNLTNTEDIDEVVWDWSPDGGFLLIEWFDPTLKREQDYEIYIMDTTGTYITRLTNNDIGDISPRWSSDGSRIAYSAFDGKDWDIFVMDADGSNKRNLSNDDYLFSSSPCWSPDGTKILFTATDGSVQQQRDLEVVNIYRINIDGSGLTKLTEGNFINQNPDWRR